LTLRHSNINEWIFEIDTKTYEILKKKYEPLHQDEKKKRIEIN
jgi:hypothetical protein